MGKLSIRGKYYNIACLDDYADRPSRRAEAEETFGPETWQRKALETVIALIEPKQHPQKKTFPCIFATKGQRNNEHRYIFLHSDDPSEPRNVRIMARALRQYLPNSRSLGPNTSVLTICPPTPEGAAKRSFEYYNRVFWDTLRGLRISDPVPWIKDIPQATSSSKWAFCYAGEAVFPVALTPLYEKRHSRWAPSFVVALQPKWVFDDLLDTPERRKNATSKVRALLKKYDDVDVSPDLTAYGDEGTSEVHQLFLRDDNDETMQCPFTNIEESHGSELDSSSGSDVASNGSGSRSNSF